MLSWFSMLIKGLKVGIGTRNYFLLGTSKCSDKRSDAMCGGKWGNRLTDRPPDPPGTHWSLTRGEENLSSVHCIFFLLVAKFYLLFNIRIMKLSCWAFATTKRRRRHINKHKFVYKWWRLGQEYVCMCVYFVAQTVLISVVTRRFVPLTIEPDGRRL